MTSKQVKITSWIISFIILIPLTFKCGFWVFYPIVDLDNLNHDILKRVLGIVTIFLIIVLFLPISKKNVKFMLVIILFTFLVSGIFIAIFYPLGGVVRF